MKLYLFDFDGTLTTGDSFVRFLIFTNGWARFFLKMPAVLWRLAALFFRGKMTAENAKAAILATFFENETRSVLEKRGADFCKKRLPDLLREPIFQQAKSARAAGNFVVVVSASPDFWLRPFCETHGFSLISTEIEFVGGRFSGRFSTKNCNGAEKARRILADFDLSEFEKVIAFGNSEGDRAMLALADEAIWVK